MAYGHTKIIAPGSYNFGEEPCVFIKRSSKGVVGKDLAELKSRTHPRIAEVMSKLAYKKDEELVHLIALGAFEYFSMNKNGDGFYKEALEDKHDTFVKHARFYRDHKSSDKLKSYGRPIWSTYYSPMHRVELIVALNSNKEAAERNNGLVADKEMEKLASGRSLAVSMGASVNYDVCSACGNQARSRSEYCRGESEGGKCRGGGLSSKMGQVVKLAGAAHALHAINPGKVLKFFDISHITTDRQADRTAYVLGQLAKTAADGRIVSGAELAEHLEVHTPDYLGVDNPDWVEAGIKLAAWERRFLGDADLAARYAQAVPHQNPPKASDVRSLETFGDWLKGASQQHVIVPLGYFLDGLCEATGRELLPPQSKQAVHRDLFGIFDENSAKDTWTEVFNERILERMPNSASVSGRTWGEKYANAYGFSLQALQSRVGRSMLSTPVQRSCFRKQASSNPASSALAKAYACYQAQVLSSWSPEIRERALPYVVAQNWTVSNTHGV